MSRNALEENRRLWLNGRPVRSTGSRNQLSLLCALQKPGRKRGVGALCIGAGQAAAVAIELN
ncbi:hypothetical protein E2F43_11340 [Seongchinamella unica]|uniref:Thiolase C-terminal domain-containing protein n=1 Tax=Seongchinamella unica TaxID=2547392 RepID=A0A4R5LT15_9GAMM|nr:hypothetical protein [Seongchinamella unica]TDG14073.1 hypothetical protein E2F43_11340 [Seongchinamella unica]